jgi:mRNA-degrading endonuclease toxin of MazEF toxin-antitoxin module
VKRGEVYLVNPQPVKGNELARIRPAVILSSQRVIDQPDLPLTMMFGAGAEHYPVLSGLHVKVDAATGHFRKDTVFSALQVKACDRRRFQDPRTGELKYLSTLDVPTMRRIEVALMFALELDGYLPLPNP